MRFGFAGFLSWLCWLGPLVCVGQAFAATDQEDGKLRTIEVSRTSELYLGVGSTANAGYLFPAGTKEGSGEFGLRFWTQRTSEGHTRVSFLEVQLSEVSPQNTVGNYFPFPNNTSVGQTAVALVGNWSLLNTDHWNYYLGVGPELLTVTDLAGNNTQNYGLLVGQVGCFYHFEENWNAGLRIQYSKIEQAYNGSSSFEEFANVSLIFSYAPEWLNRN